jgi:hypothetical protein
LIYHLFFGVITWIKKDSQTLSRRFGESVYSLRHTLFSLPLVMNGSRVGMQAHMDVVVIPRFSHIFGKLATFINSMGPSSDALPDC